jgi:hypothetical protein
MEPSKSVVAVVTNKVAGALATRRWCCTAGVVVVNNQFSLVLADGTQAISCADLRPQLISSETVPGCTILESIQLMAKLALLIPGSGIVVNRFVGVLVAVGALWLVWFSTPRLDGVIQRARISLGLPG